MFDYDSAYFSSTDDYSPMTYPIPSFSHREYPSFTPGGGDNRWYDIDGLEEGGREWVGTLMLVRCRLVQSITETLSLG